MDDCPGNGQGFQYLPCQGLEPLPPDAAYAGGRGAVRFAYEKADGTLRRAAGTLHEVAATIKGTGRPDDGCTVKYYDVEADGWRSFKVENFVTVY